MLHDGHSPFAILALEFRHPARRFALPERAEWGGIPNLGDCRASSPNVPPDGRFVVYAVRG